MQVYGLKLDFGWIGEVFYFFEEFSGLMWSWCCGHVWWLEMMFNDSRRWKKWLSAINFCFGRNFRKLGFVVLHSARIYCTMLEAELAFAQNMKVVGIGEFEVPTKFQVIWICVEWVMSILLLLIWVAQNVKTALVIVCFDWNWFRFCCWCLLRKCSWMS